MPKKTVTNIRVEIDLTSVIDVSMTIELLPLKLSLFRQIEISENGCSL